MMKRKETSSIPKQSFLTIRIAVVLALSSIWILSSCSNTADTSNSAVSSVSVESAESVNHNVAMNPAPLTIDDQALSVVGYGAIGAFADQNLSIVDMLMYAVQDEYFAHGEYLSIIENFGDQRPYTNIMKAEESHLALLEELYLSYGLDFPEDGSKEHIAIPDHLLEAAQTGVQAEIDNIAMYEIFLTYDLPENIFEVFTSLKSGSESHLLAFQKQVDKLN